MEHENILQLRESNSNVHEQDNIYSYMDVRRPQHVSSEKVIQMSDIVYDFIRLPGYCWFFIDTPEMQRLKNIHQLGPNYYVFPGATHNRFEHSCGVAHLCNQ
jgi:hypothetical protein